MAGKPDAVAETVGEVLAVACVCDHVAGRSVELAGGNAGLGGLARGVERALQHRVGLEEVLRCLGHIAHDVGAGAVGLVSGGQRAAKVHHHRVALFEDAVGEVVVRVGAVGPGADDDELHVRMFFKDQRV